MFNLTLPIVVGALSITSASAANQVPRSPPGTPPTILWEDCSNYVLYYGGPPDRLRCGKIEVPVDHGKPELGVIKVSVTRVAAKAGASRRGAIVVNPGGPGAPNGLRFAQNVFSYWSEADPGHPTGRLLKQVVDEYDIVGFLPRGTGTTERREDPDEFVLTCVSEQLVPTIVDPDDRGTANITAMLEKGRVTAAGCQKQPLASHVNTEQTVRDLDLIRQALGDERISFYGASYGTWMGAWYAILFPEHIARLVLDSSADFTKPFETATLNQMRSIQDVADKVLIPEITGRPAYYNLGTDPAYIGSMIASLPPKLRQIVRAASLGDVLATYPNYGLPLTTAQGLGQLFRENPDVGEERMKLLSSRHTYSPDYEAAGAAQYYAEGMIRGYFSSNSARPLNLNKHSSVHWAVFCGDTSLSNKDAAYWSNIGNQYASPAGLADTEEITSTPCISWRGPYAQKPAPEKLVTLPATLMLQLQHDPLTPLHGARAMHDAIPRSSLAVLKEGRGHGIIAHRNQCMSGLLGEYLINGTLPPTDVQCSADDARQASMFQRPLQAEKRRQELLESIMEANGVVSLAMKDGQARGEAGSAGK